jgi:hypothetical protein
MRSPGRNSCQTALGSIGVQQEKSNGRSRMTFTVEELATIAYPGL